MNCGEVRKEIAVGLLMGTDLDEPTRAHIATCRAQAAAPASLRQDRSLGGLGR